MTKETEEQLIHDVLAEMMRKPAQSQYLIFLPSFQGEHSGSASIILDRMISLGLIESSVTDKLTIGLTPHGMDIGRHLGGYLGYQQAESARRAQEQQAQAEKDKLDRDAAVATVSSADASKSSAKAAWVAAIFSLISIAISVIALLKPDKSEELQSQLTALQQQVMLLKTQPAMPRASQPLLPSTVETIPTKRPAVIQAHPRQR